VLIQVDGVRVPYGFSFGAQDAGRGDYVDIGLIKSVEFLRGPASALYGSDGLAGAVSFVTSDPPTFWATNPSADRCAPSIIRRTRSSPSRASSRGDRARCRPCSPIPGATFPN
jgi:outer membrane cobalamin receptor